MPQLAQIMKQTLPRRLIRLREQHGLTQKALAEGAGLAASTVNEIESGLAGDMMLSTLVLIAAQFEVTPDFLLGCDDAGDNFARSAMNLGEEIARLSESGWSDGALASRFGISREAVAKILADEYEAMRLRRVRS